MYSWVAVKVGCYAGRHSGIVTGVDTGRTERKSPFGVSKERIGVDIARAGPAALNVAVCDGGRAANELAASVAPENAVGDRRAAVFVIYPSAVDGGIAGKGAVGYGGVADCPVEHPAAVDGDITGKGAVGHRRTGLVVFHPTAVEIGAIVAEGAVGDSRAAEPVIHPATPACRVIEEVAVGHGGAAVVVGYPAAAFVDCGIAAEGTVGHRRVAVMVGNPAGEVAGGIAGEVAVGHSRAAVIVMNPAAHEVGGIVAEGAVGHHWAAARVVHPAA